LLFWFYRFIVAISFSFVDLFGGYLDVRDLDFLVDSFFDFLDDFFGSFLDLLVDLLVLGSFLD